MSNIGTRSVRYYMRVRRHGSLETGSDRCSPLISIHYKFMGTAREQNILMAVDDNTIARALDWKHLGFILR